MLVWYLLARLHGLKIKQKLHIVNVGLGLIFIFILMNIQINKISFMYFLLHNYHLFHLIN